jgi:hypothetical protein
MPLPACKTDERARLPGPAAATRGLGHDWAKRPHGLTGGHRTPGDSQAAPAGRRGEKKHAGGATGQRRLAATHETTNKGDGQRATGQPLDGGAPGGSRLDSAHRRPGPGPGPGGPERRKNDEGRLSSTGEGSRNNLLICALGAADMHDQALGLDSAHHLPHDRGRGESAGAAEMDARHGTQPDGRDRNTGWTQAAGWRRRRA